MKTAFATCESINKKDLDLILSMYPTLKDRPEERAFLIWLIKDWQWIDRNSLRVMIPHNLLKCFTSKQRTGDFLKGFQAIFPGFTYQNYWHEGNQCRVMKENGLEPELVEILFHAPSDERFSGRTLKRIRPYQEKVTWRERREEAKQQTWTYADQQLIADYLHARQMKPFLDMRKETFPAAWEIAKQRNDGGSQLRALHAWYDDPFPRYHPTGKTPRVFGTAAQFLAKDVRQALFAGCYELDLQNCQLAIIGGILGIEAVQQRMKSGVPVWGELLSHLGIAAEQSKVAKPAVKTALYSTVYGMGPQGVEICLQKDLHAEGVETNRRLLTHPLMEEVVAALQYAKAQVVKNGGMMSAYGWMSWQGEDLNSFLSIVIQSYETAIIAEVYRVIARDEENEDRRCTALLHQHDGTTIQLSPGTELSTVLSRLQPTVEQKAAEYGIITSIAA